MPKNAVSQWDTVAANNTDVGGITLDGAVMTPSLVDNAVRELMAQVAVQLGDMGVKGADIASATTTNLANATGWYLDITGTTTITGFGTVNAGQIYMLRFTGALTLTYNASSLILPGAANITTAAGDVAFMMSLGSGNWRCLVYQRASGLAGDVTLTGTQTLTNKTLTSPTLSGTVAGSFTIDNGSGDTPALTVMTNLIPSLPAITGAEGGLQINNGGNASASAVMAFHRQGVHALYFGLDIDNKMKIGGWSLGANAYPMVVLGSSTYNVGNLTINGTLTVTG